MKPRLSYPGESQPSRHRGEQSSGTVQRELSAGKHGESGTRQGGSQSVSALAGDLENLKLAPLLARKLDSSSPAGSKGSKSPARSPAMNNSDHAIEFAKLPSLLRTLEGRNSDSNRGLASVVGSSNLPQIMQNLDTSSPSTSKTPNSAVHSFELAKRQVDTDLRVFKKDTMSQLVKLQGSAAWKADPGMAQEQAQQIMRLVDCADECLECHVEDFRVSIMSTVDEIEDDRSQVENRKIKALYTKLLLILTRCSRLLITEQDNLFATEPRQARYQGGLSFTDKGASMAMQKLLTPPPAEDDADDAILRCHTMPVKQLAAMAKQLQSAVSVEHMASTDVSERHSRTSASTMRSKQSASSMKSKIGSEMSLKLSHPSNLHAHRESGSPRGSDQLTPAALDNQFAEAASSKASPFTSSDPYHESGLAGSSSDRKKSKSIIKRITSKLQGTFSRRKLTVMGEESDQEEAGRQESRPGSFLGAALSLFKGGSSLTTPRSSTGGYGSPKRVQGSPHGLATQPSKSNSTLGALVARSSSFLAGDSPSKASGRQVATPASAPHSGALTGSPKPAASNVPGTAVLTSAGIVSLDALKGGARPAGAPAGVLKKGGLARKDRESSAAGSAGPSASGAVEASSSTGAAGGDRPTGARGAARVRFAAEQTTESVPGQAGEGGSEAPLAESRSSGYRGAANSLAIAMKRAASLRSVEGGWAPATSFANSRASSLSGITFGERAWSSMEGTAVADTPGVLTREQSLNKSRAHAASLPGVDPHTSGLSSSTSQGAVHVFELRPHPEHPSSPSAAADEEVSQLQAPYVTTPVKGIDPADTGHQRQWAAASASSPHRAISSPSHSKPPRPESGHVQGGRPWSTGQPPPDWQGQQGSEAGQQEEEGDVEDVDMEEVDAEEQQDEEEEEMVVEGGAPQGEYGADRPSPEDLVVVCSICEEEWPTSRLEEHSELCAVLQQLSYLNLSVDAKLTMLANVIEEQLDMGELWHYLRPEIQRLVNLARSAAALQPDGSKVPCTRCLAVKNQLYDLSDLSTYSRNSSTITVTYARRMLKLVEDKLCLLYEPIRPDLIRGEGDSGTSTPHSALPGMSIEEFEIIKPISRGAFGRVYLARKHATGDLFAIKVMKKRDLIRKNMVESVTNERNILAMANNPFVVRFYYSFTSKENLYIVMEYLSGGDCYSLLRKMGALSEDVARLYVAETVLALEYCHAQGIIHRDMKPDNMLISANGHVKLTDFGLSCIGVIDRTDNLGTGAQQATDSMDVDEPGHWARDDEYDRESQMGRGSPMDPDRESGQAPASPSTPGITYRSSPPERISTTSHIPEVMIDPGAHISVDGRSSAPSQLGHIQGQEADHRLSLPGTLAQRLAYTSQAAPAGLNSHSTSNLNPHSRTSNSSLLGNASLSMSRENSQRRLRNFASANDKSSAGGMAAAAQSAVSTTPTFTPSFTPPLLSPAPTMRRAPEHEAKRAVGTPDYLAPELLLGTGHGPEVDWWALGAILYEMVMGIPPFNASTPEEIFDNILDRAISWPDDEEDMSLQCRDLVDKLLQPNPLKRLGHRGAGEIKLHPWFKGVDWTDLARTKAAFVPVLDDEEDTSYFEKKHVSAKSMAEDLDTIDTWKRRHHRQSDSNTAAGSTDGSISQQQQQVTQGDRGLVSHPSGRTSLDPTIRDRLQQAEMCHSGRSSSTGSRMSAQPCISREESSLSREGSHLHLSGPGSNSLGSRHSHKPVLVTSGVEVTRGLVSAPSSAAPSRQVSVSGAEGGGGLGSPSLAPVPLLVPACPQPIPATQLTRPHIGGQQAGGAAGGDRTSCGGTSSRSRLMEVTGFNTVPPLNVAVPAPLSTQVSPTKMSASNSYNGRNGPSSPALSPTCVSPSVQLAQELGVQGAPALDVLQRGMGSQGGTGSVSPQGTSPGGGLARSDSPRRHSLLMPGERSNLGSRGLRNNNNNNNNMSMLRSRRSSVAMSENGSGSGASDRAPAQPQDRESRPSYVAQHSTVSQFSGGGGGGTDSGAMDDSHSSSGEGEGLEGLGLPPGVDPFGNFSYTNYNGLSQANADKLMRLRELYGSNFGSSSQYAGSPAMSSSTNVNLTGPPSMKRVSLSGALPSAPVVPHSASVLSRLASNSGLDHQSAPLYQQGSRSMSRDNSDARRAESHADVAVAAVASALPPHVTPEYRQHSSPQIVLSADASLLATSGPYPEVPYPGDDLSVPLQPRLSQPPDGYPWGFSSVPSAPTRTSASGLPPSAPALDRQYTRGSLSVLTANLLQQQVSTLMRQQSNASGVAGQQGMPLQSHGSLRMRLTSGSDSSPNAFMPPAPIQLPFMHSSNACSTPDSEHLSSSAFESPNDVMPASLNLSHPHLYQPSPLNACNSATSVGSGGSGSNPSAGQQHQHQPRANSPGLPLGKRPSWQVSRRSSLQQLGLVKPGSGMPTDPGAASRSSHPRGGSPSASFDRSSGPASKRPSVNAHHMDWEVVNATDKSATDSDTPQP